MNEKPRRTQSRSADLQRFADLSFEEFRKLAKDQSLSEHERVGFPDGYRQGREKEIVTDIASKIGPLVRPARRLVDIGPGCSSVARLLVETALAGGLEVSLVDSDEMLSELPSWPGVEKVTGRFPECRAKLTHLVGGVDALLAYSVLHYVFREGLLFDFVDSALSLLAPGGKLLLGDIPNVSKRRRFFASPAGQAFHREFVGRDEEPAVEFNRLEAGAIDDGVLLGLLVRARSAGFDAYLVPQPDHLPMANRREDLLIVRP